MINRENELKVKEEFKYNQKYAHETKLMKPEDMTPNILKGRSEKDSIKKSSMILNRPPKAKIHIHPAKFTKETAHAGNVYC